MKYCLVCPNCKSEIPYNDKYYDDKIRELGTRIYQINQRQAEINKISPSERIYTGEKKVLQREKEQLSKQIAALKSFRKSANKLRDEFVFSAFKEIVKEKYGKEEFMKILEEAQRNVSTYTTEELMTIGYSRKHGKRVNKV